MPNADVVLIDAVGRRRSNATLPGYLAGRAPRNKGMTYPADPPRVEEIIAVMRLAGDDRHGLRVRAVIAVLWRGGLRISEALALSETDVDPARGSVLIRHGKGDKRREVGMDDWGFEHLNRWLEDRVLLPVGPLFCIIDGPTRRPRGTAKARRPGGCSPPVRAAPAEACARGRACQGGGASQHNPATARAYRPRDHQHLLAGDRSERDRQRRPLPPAADDACERSTGPMSTRAP